tara:strand:+ start:65246 stop:65395 length:150 start_codon:yes stop_codon:yes gene_type:complete
MLFFKGIFALMGGIGESSGRGRHWQNKIRKGRNAVFHMFGKNKVYFLIA